MPTYIAGFEIDAVVTEDRTSECEVTDHPVEKGVSITDHARVKPKVISMECVVSDTPVGALADRRGLALEDEVERELADQGVLSDYVASDEARAFVEKLLVARKPVLVSTEWKRTDGSLGYKAYDNMMIQTIGETIDSDTGDSFKFTVTLKQITYVTNNRTTVRVAVPRAKKKNDKGNKGNKDAKAVPEKNTSWAKDAKDAGVKFYKDVGGIGGLVGF